MGECPLCDEVITNPVCMSCLENEILQWLDQKKPELYRGIKDIKKEFGMFDEKISDCILCRKEITVCPGCYVKEIHDFLEGINKSLAEEFLLHFNFDIDSIPRVMF